MVEIAVNIYQIDKMCRLCLTTGVTLFDIFHSSTRTKNRVADVIMQCAPVKIKKCDEMPNFICRLCYTQLEKNHQFQAQIVQSEKTLRRYLQQLRASGKQIKTECSEDPLIPTESSDDTFSRYDGCDDTKNDFGNSRLTQDINWKEKEHANFDSENKVKEETTFNFGIKDEVIMDENSLLSPECNDPFETFSNGSENNCENPKIDFDHTSGNFQRPWSADVTEDFDKRENTSVHKEASKMKYVCDVCNKCFLYPSTLNNHYRTHTGEKPFECDVCNKRFALLNTLKKHKRIHTDEKPYRCDFCNKQFTQLTSLNCHKCTHAGEKRSADAIEDLEERQPMNKNLPVNEININASTSEYKCDFCNKCFPNPSSLNTHRRKHTGEKPYQCDICKKNFAQLHHLKRHNLIHTDEKPYRCNVCNKQFMHVSNLDRHKRKHHVGKRSADEIEEKSESENKHISADNAENASNIEFRCEFCKKCYPHLMSLNKHIRVHYKPHVCDVCNKHFSELANLKRHQYTHTGEKRFMCDVCSRRFTEMTHLKNHKRIHTGEKPYQCDVCNRHFAFYNDMTRHKRTHTGEKPYKCDVCNKQFVQSQHLKIHKRTHTGERPYQCDVCDKRFARKSCVSVHKRTHTGERPYQCDVCNKCFVMARHLSTHKRIHTGEKPYRCDVCNMCFTYSFSLKKHKTTHS